MVLPRFLTELKRRKVYRVALVYSGVGWVLLEAADVVLPRLGLPDWSVNLVLAVVLLGFPLALVFAWIFDLTPQGVVRTQPVSPETHHRFSSVSIAELFLICILVATVGYLYVDRLSLQERLVVPESVDSEEPGILNPAKYRAIAVLPFADMSETRDQAWFAEGIAEELLIALSQVKQLSVMARTSSFAFKGTDKTVAEIADILGVQAVLEGSVRRSRDRVRITAQLVDANTGFHIWSGSYERQITDIFELQDELAKSVVEALRIELGVGTSVPLVAEQTRIPEAYNWFMRGRALFDWANPQATLRSLSHFKKAVEIDPNYAAAWGYLSYSRNTMMLFRPFEEVGPPSIAAFESALALDPEQSEALATKAVMTLLLDHDWEAAGRLYQRAVASNESQNALGAYAVFYLQFIGRQTRAIELISNAVKLDPLHAGNNANLAGIFYWSGDNEGAIRKAREALQLDPEHMLAIQYLIAAYTDTKDIVALELLLGSIPPALQEQPDVRALVGWSYAVRGDEEKARKIYRELVESIDSLTPLEIFNIAYLALSLGEVDESVDLLERLEEGGSWMQFWSKLLSYKSVALREHPHYQALLKRMGLDDESVAALHRKMSFD
jgi:TolB-like protein/Flp pilus assembly protein TadD